MNIQFKSNPEYLPRIIPQNSLLRSNLDELVDRFFSGGRSIMPSAEWLPSLDLKEDDKEVTVLCDLPGVDPKALDISLSGRTLTIRGERRSEKVDDKDNYYFAERTFGSFVRAIDLPQPIDAEHMFAEHKDGVLTIKLRKIQSAVTKKIPVNGRS